MGSGTMCGGSEACTVCAIISPLALQDAHKAQVDGLIKRAQQQCSKLGDDKLTMEHMVLALAENQR